MVIHLAGLMQRPRAVSMGLNVYEKPGNEARPYLPITCPQINLGTLLCRSVQDGGETTDSKPPGSLTSLRDAPALPGTAKPSLPPLDGQGALQLGFGLDMEKLIGTQGDYEEDFHRYASPLGSKWV